MSLPVIDIINLAPMRYVLKEFGPHVRNACLITDAVWIWKIGQLTDEALKAAWHKAFPALIFDILDIDGEKQAALSGILAAGFAVPFYFKAAQYTPSQATFLSAPTIYGGPCGLPVIPPGKYDYPINWGDETPDAFDKRYNEWVAAVKDWAVAP